MPVSPLVSTRQDMLPVQAAKTPVQEQSWQTALNTVSSDPSVAAQTSPEAPAIVSTNDQQISGTPMSAAAEQTDLQDKQQVNDAEPPARQSASIVASVPSSPVQTSANQTALSISSTLRAVTARNNESRAHMSDSNIHDADTPLSSPVLAVNDSVGTSTSGAVPEETKKHHTQNPSQATQTNVSVNPGVPNFVQQDTPQAMVSRAEKGNSTDANIITSASVNDTPASASTVPGSVPTNSRAAPSPNASAMAPSAPDQALPNQVMSVAQAPVSSRTPTAPSAAASPGRAASIPNASDKASAQSTSVLTAPDQTVSEQAAPAARTPAFARAPVAPSAAASTGGTAPAISTSATISAQSTSDQGSPEKIIFAVQTPDPASTPAAPSASRSSAVSIPNASDKASAQKTSNQDSPEKIMSAVQTPDPPSTPAAPSASPSSAISIPNASAKASAQKTSDQDSPEKIMSAVQTPDPASTPAAPSTALASPNNATSISNVSAKISAQSTSDQGSSKQVVSAPQTPAALSASPTGSSPKAQNQAVQIPSDVQVSVTDNEVISARDTAAPAHPGLPMSAKSDARGTTTLQSAPSSPGNTDKSLKSQITGNPAPVQSINNAVGGTSTSSTDQATPTKHSTDIGESKEAANRPLSTAAILGASAAIQTSASAQSGQNASPQSPTTSSPQLSALATKPAASTDHRANATPSTSQAIIDHGLNLARLDYNGTSLVQTDNAPGKSDDNEQTVQSLTGIIGPSHVSTTMVIDKTDKTVPLNSAVVADNINTSPAALSATITALHQAGQNAVMLRLDPPGLGHLSIQIKTDAQGAVNVLFVPTTVEAAQALQGSLPQLGSAMAQSGLVLGQAGVGGQFSQSGGQGNQQNFQAPSRQPSSLSANAAPDTPNLSGLSAYA